MNRTWLTAPLAAVLIVSPQARAETPDLIITATRLATAPDAATSSVSVLTETDLERRQARFLVDEIATLPGVIVNQNGRFGGAATIRIRGASSDQTLVLVDGVPVNDPTTPGGLFDAAFLEAPDIARVEVLRGPQSTLWGSNAIGGVVNVVTRRPSPGVSARGFAEIGSFDTRRAGLSGGYGGERVDGRLGVSWTSTDGISKADEDDGNTETDPYDSLAFTARAGVDVTSALRLEAFGRASASESAFDDFGVATGVTDGPSVVEIDERSGGVSARLRAFDGRLENTLTLSRAEVERRNTGAFSFGSEGVREALRWQGTLQASKALRLAFGAEREDSESKGVGAIRIDGAFALAELTPTTGVVLTAGIRRDDNSRFGAVTTGRVGARVAVNEAVGVRASFGQGFRAPSIFQLTAFFPPATGPNLELKAEEAEGWDAAIFVDQPRLTAELGLFGLTVENQIDFAAGRYVNIARVETKGVEASGRYALTPRFDLSGQYTLTDAENALTGARLLRVPRHAAYLAADWRATERLGLGAAVRHNGSEQDFPYPTNPDGKVAAWTRLDLTARFAVSDALEVYGRIENATDANYQDVYGYGTPGASAFIGVRVRRR
jgi:vitamin B12 transporter